MSQALLTIHNTFRELSRNKEALKDIPQDLSFFHTYLDGDAVGKGAAPPSEDISDEWYHFFGMATMAYVGDSKGSFGAAMDWVNNSKGYDKKASAATIIGILNAGMNPINLLFNDTPGTNIAMNDAVGEQAAYGWLAKAGDYYETNKPFKGAKTWYGEMFSRIGNIGTLAVGLVKGLGGIETDEFMGEVRGASFGAMIAKKVPH